MARGSVGCTASCRYTYDSTDIIDVSAKKLFNLALEQMKKGGVDEVVLETE